MSNLLNREQARFLRAPQPVLLVALPDEFGPLPELTSDAAGAPAALAGWSVLAGGTLCVVDGPGDLGFLLPTLAAADELADSMAWAGSVADCGGAYVFQVDEKHLDTPLDKLVQAPGTRGGFVESVR
jgi:hypothetical protein